MNRRRRTEILIRGSRALAQSLYMEIAEHYGINGIEEPNNGLVMVKMREEAQKSLFYIGEVLVTEAKVQVGGKLGIGLLRGNDTELAYWLAVIDAAYHAALEETKAWEVLLLAEEKKLREEMSHEQSRVLRTKVAFDSMDQ